MFIEIGLLAFSALSVQVQASTAQQSEPDQLQRLKTLLAGRDAAIQSLCLPYEAVQPETGGNSAWRERGVWVMEHDVRLCAALTGNVAGVPSLSWSYWSGVDGYVAGREASWASESALDWRQPPSFERFVPVNAPSMGQLSYAHSPFRLGLGVLNVGWGSYIGRFSEIKVLGRSDVDGQNCLRLLLDMDGRKMDGVYTYPWIVDFDDQKTMLAIRVVTYFGTDVLPTGTQHLEQDQATLDLDGRTWRVRQRVEVKDVHHVRDAIWVGTEGIVVQYEPSGQRSETLVTVEKSGVELNFDAPRWLGEGFRPARASLDRR